MQNNLQKQQKAKIQLTKAQEAFVNALIKGGNQRHAYLKAYPKSKTWTDNAVDCAASKLMHNAKVLQRFNELNEKVAQKHEEAVIFDTTQLRAFWTKILNDNKAGMTNRLKASELLGKSQGMFVEKRETTFTAEDCVIRIKKHEDD